MPSLQIGMTEYQYITVHSREDRGGQKKNHKHHELPGNKGKVEMVYAMVL